MKINSIQTITTKCTTYDAEERSKMSKEEIYQDMISRQPIAHCGYMGFGFDIYDVSCVNGEKMLTGILDDDKFPSTISLKELTKNNMKPFIRSSECRKIFNCTKCPSLPKPL